MQENAEETKETPAKPVAKKKARGGLSLNVTRLRKMIRILMDNLEKENNSSKPSVSELLKLLQVYKELTAEQVKEVEVRWVDRLRVDEESGT